MTPEQVHTGFTVRNRGRFAYQRHDFAEAQLDATSEIPV
jgi:hypothetical protein